MAVTPITISDLTTTLVNGDGVFDKLMQAGNAHIDGQFKAGRLQGTDYATVYLGLINASMQNALNFLANKDKISLEADLIDAQIRAAEAGILATEAQVKLTEAQTDVQIQQLQNLTKQAELLDAQIITEGIQQKVLDAQVCKLKAEYDLTVETTQKTTNETALLAQKLITEKAQVLELGVDDNSVIGRQKALYAAQTAGFKSDKIQKGTKIMTDTWQARRMTDDGVVADDTNKLSDASIGEAVAMLKADMAQ